MAADGDGGDDDEGAVLLEMMKLVLVLMITMLTGRAVRMKMEDYWIPVQPPPRTCFHSSAVVKGGPYQCHVGSSAIREGRRILSPQRTGLGGSGIEQGWVNLARVWAGDSSVAGGHGTLCSLRPCSFYSHHQVVFTAPQGLVACFPS